MKTLLLALVAIAPTCVTAQTIFVQPANLTHGSLLPATCVVGDTYQLTSASSGQQWYMCESANTWKQEGGGGSTASVPTASASGATLTLFPQCASGCSVSKGSNQVSQFTATNTVTAPASGSGTIFIEWTSSGCQVLSNSATVTISGSGPCAGTSTSGSGFTNDETALIASVAYTPSTWGVPNNYQPTASNPPVISVGTGITSSLSPGVQQLAADTSVVATHSALTQNLVPHADSTGYNLVNGLIYDDGTKTGAGGTPDAGYTFQANGTSTGIIYLGVGNHDATNVGSAAFCQVVNGAASATCITQLGSAASGGPAWQIAGNGDFSFITTSGSVEHFRVYNAGGIKVPAQALASLGTCNAGKEGTIGRANDLTNAITWGTTAAGGGTSHAMLVCNGTNWVVMGQ